MAGGAHAIGNTEEDQPGEQRLGQGDAPGHRLGHVENLVADGEQRLVTTQVVAQVEEQGVEIIEDYVNEGHKRHGREQERDKAFLEVVPDAQQGVHR
ncbi:hypothetical protein D3C72_2014370 [compost metagenome]